jgi:hypothetical protein
MRLIRGRPSDERAFVKRVLLWHDGRRPDQERDAMNKIIREHYPVENLPADLREGLTEGSTVRVVVEIESQAPSPAKESFDEFMKQVEAYRSQDDRRVTTAEAVARIRELRDEWDD